MGHFAELCAGFRKCHSNPLNVALHVLTTPACIFAVYCLVNQYIEQDIVRGVTALYCLSLLPWVPFAIFVLNTAVFAALCIGSSMVPCACAQLWSGVFVAAYILQEVSHWITGEITYQSTYQKKQNFFGLLLQHTYFLMPLVLDAIPNVDGHYLTWIVAQNTVVHTKLTASKEKANLAYMRQWILDQKPSTERTTHWWFNKLDEKPKKAFEEIATSEGVLGMFREKFSKAIYNVEVLEGMNEIYVACEQHKMNSDTVFYMQHIDGPWYMIPFCGAYRCILAVNENERICTRFPMAPAKHTLTNGDIVGFDFNREIHYIENNPGTVRGKEPRMTLKLHYVVYPKALKPLGKLLGYLTTLYDINARKLFLATIKPTGWFSQLTAYGILVVTNLMFLGEKLVGYYNMVYFGLAILGNFLLHDRFYLCATSFMHYLMYLGTYHQKTNVSYGTFLRNVIFFKTLALINLAYFYLTNFQYDPISLAMIVVGYGISGKAAMALGVEKTYFGVELGICKPKWVDAFPYNVIPHPMIVGSILGLLGIFKMEGFREAVPYLVPVHIFLYTCHMLQEIVFDVYRQPKKID